MKPSDVEELLAADRAHLIHPLSELRAHARRKLKLFERGAGLELEMADGHRVIDAFSGLLNINVGHGRAEIIEAVTAQMEQLAYYPSFWDFASAPAAKLAARIAGLLPADRQLTRMMFNLSGSEANEAAYKIARLYHAVRGEPQRQKILSRRWSFHGSTKAAGSATGIDVYHALLEQDPTHLHFAAPYCYRCPFGKARESCALECADDLAALLEREGPETVAAVVVEPVMGTGGIIPPPDGYFDRLQEIARAHGVLLILDEVITGFGRTGRWFGMEHWGIEPDLVCFGKGITSGVLPLSATVMTEPVYQTLAEETPRGQPFMFGLTYNNHPTCCMAALANIDIIEREGLVDNAREVGGYMLAQLRERFGDSPIAGDIRGIGMMAAIEVVGDRETREPFPNIAWTNWIAGKAFRKGLIVRPMLQCVGLAPPLCAERGDIDRILDLLAPVWQGAEKRIAR